MKKSMRKLPVLLFLICAFVLSGCSGKEHYENESTYQTRSDESLTYLVSLDEASLQAQIDYLENDIDLDQYVNLYPYLNSSGERFPFSADAYLSLFTSYLANLDEFGTYVGLVEYEGGTTDEDGNVSYSTVYEFSEHNMRLTLEFDKNDVVTTVTMDPIYSTGEIAEKAALNTLIGMGSVFVVLILLAFLISLFKYISVIENAMKKSKDKKAGTAQSAAEAAPAAAPAPAAVQSAAPKTDDLALVAVITAAIAQESGMPADGFVVRSIRRRENNKWKRA